jgi:hypothetical protein
MRSRRTWSLLVVALGSIAVAVIVSHLGSRARAYMPDGFGGNAFEGVGAFDTQMFVFVMKENDGSFHCDTGGDSSGELEFTIVFDASDVRAYRAARLPFGGERCLRYECTGRASGGVGNREVPIPSGVMKDAVKLAGQRPEFIGVTAPWSPTPAIYCRTDWMSVGYVVGSWGSLAIGAMALLALCGHLVRGTNRRLRAQAGRCEHCNYDRRGLPVDAECPECGTRLSK